MSELTEDLAQVKEVQKQVFIQMEANQQEGRDAINNFIIANEVTRDLAQNVAKLAIATSQQ